jgi:MFS transporter, DHA3 family, multidrug efflux protein
MILGPIIEASEQTVVQKIVPLEEQGRVVGFGQSIENIASPVMAFAIGPIAQFVTIPFMTTGLGATTIGSWFGTGDARGIALLFSIAGLIGLIFTVILMYSNMYKQLENTYNKS